jgi:hypothetical protein
MPAPHDPTKPIVVTVSLESPQVVDYRLWYKRPTDPAWTVFANGDHQKPLNSFPVDPLPADSELAYHIRFIGNPETAFRARITLAQQSQQFMEVPIEGTTNKLGVAVREETFPLA